MRLWGTRILPGGEGRRVPRQVGLYTIERRDLAGSYVARRGRTAAVAPKLLYYAWLHGTSHREVASRHSVVCAERTVHRPWGDDDDGDSRAGGNGRFDRPGIGVAARAGLHRGPLLPAAATTDAPPTARPCLRIDRFDRADEELEAFMLEVLSDYQITVPGIRMLRVARPPVLIITSNRTRGLHDLLKRRCLYRW